MQADRTRESLVEHDEPPHCGNATQPSAIEPQAPRAQAPDLKAENLRNAILGIQKFPGAEGEYNFDQNGDGLDHYNIVQNEKGNIIYFKTLRVAR